MGANRNTPMSANGGVQGHQAAGIDISLAQLGGQTTKQSFHTTAGAPRNATAPLNQSQLQGALANSSAAADAGNQSQRQGTGPNQVDVSIINQYETALQLLNTELQKLLLRNDQLQKENTSLKQQVHQLQAQKLNSTGQLTTRGEALPGGGDGQNATTLWLNSQLKDAKSQLFDLRHQIQNYNIEIRAINDKRDMERKELAVAQEKLAETISASRQLEQRYD